MAEPTKPRQQAAQPKSETNVRDLFIAHALAGMLSRPYPGESDTVAEKIIEYVDAVMAAREAPAKEPERISA